MSRRLTSLVFLVGVLLGMPRQGEAALLDIIWGLSGPQLIGIGAGCRWDFNLQRDVCEIGMAPGKARLENARSRLFFSVGGTYFFSTSKDGASGVPYSWNDVKMFALEPSVSVGWAKHGVAIHHGIGPSFDYFFGSRFKSFDKVGIRTTPIEIVTPDRHFALALTVRLYPNGFTDDEFGFGNRRNYNRPFEAVYGLSAGFAFK